MTTVRVPFLIALIALSLAWMACASGGDSEGSAAASRTPDAPPGSALAQVELGMSDIEVRRLLGDPDDSTTYMTDKAWLPFYRGSDTHRSEWVYAGEGRVVFSMNRRNGALRVIHFLYEPDASE